MPYRARIVSIIAVAALLLAACGGGGGDQGGSGEEPIRVGVITSLTGPYSVLGKFVQNAVTLMADELNEQGGINGRQVEFIIKDDQTDPTQAVAAFRELNNSGVSALIGPISSSSCMAIVDRVNEAQIPMVTTCATQAQVEPIREYVFMSTLSTPAQIERLVEYFEAQNMTDIALLRANSAFGQAGEDALQKVAPSAGINVVEQVTFQSRATTFVAQLNAAAGANPDAILAWGAGPPLVTITKEYKRLGIQAPLVLSAAAATPLYFGPAGDAAEGVTMASSAANLIDFVPQDSPIKPIVQDLAGAYQSKYNTSMSQFTADVCGAFRVLVQALKKAGAENHQAIRDAIESQPVVGCHGTYNYSANDHAGLPPEAVWVATVEDGKLTPTEFSREAAR